MVSSMRTNDLLADLLIEWEVSFEDGNEKTSEELGGSNQDLVEELRKRIKALKATEWMDLSGSFGGSEKTNQDYSGQTINNRYLIESFLGSGGHASVWAALDLKLARRVAVKIPHNASISSNLQAEGQRIALLKHPNILPVFDFGNWGDLTFIVTELVTGISLEKTIAKSRLSPFRACQIIQSVAGALDHAHAYQIVHLDVKPSNILVDQDGTARLCDFGVAVSSAAPTHTLTGTLQYMAPEQVSGQKVSPRTDIYSLGVLVHLLFTGELPYRARHPVEFKDAIASGSVCLAGDLSPRSCP
jgi:serine/threonine protein kinase